MKTSKKYFVLIYLCMVFLLPTKAQNYLGKAFTEKDLNTHPIMWSATTDKYGRIYFANNNGVTRHNGQSFYTFKTNNPVRGLVFGEDHKIYVACLGDFGLLSFEANGNYTYKSLKEQLQKKDVKTGGSEQVFKIGNSIYFSCQNYLVKLNITDNTQIDYKDIVANNSGIFEYESKLYVNTPNFGLGIFEKGKIKIIAGGNELIGKNIAAACQAENKMILAEPNGQTFELQQNKLKVGLKLPGQNIVALSALPNNKIAFGTLNNGAYVFDISNKTSVEIESQSKEIYTLFTDIEGSLWTAHSRGLQHTWLQVPIKEINTKNIIGNISDICWFKSQLYVCSSGGIYQYSEGNIRPIHKQSIECWDIQAYQDKLYLASTDGLLLIENNQLKTIIPGETFLHLQIGNQTGILYAMGENGIWQISGLGSASKINNSPSLAKGIIEEEQKIRYVVSYQDGLFDAKTNKKYFATKGGNNTLRIWKGRPYFQHNQWLYSLPLSTENEDANQEATKAIGLNQNKDLQIEVGSLLWTNNGIKVAGNDGIEPISLMSIIRGKTVSTLTQNDVIWIAQTDKIFAVAATNFNLKTPQIIFNSLVSKNDSFAYQGFYFNKAGFSDKQQEIIPSLSNESLPITLQFSLNTLINPEAHHFCYKIDEITDTYSDWQSLSQIEWPSAAAGTYTIHVKGMDAYGQISEESTFKFYIQVPWYLSGGAYLVYLIALAFIIYLIVILNQKQLITKNKKLEAKVKERTKELEEEKGKSDSLLLNILPQEVAEELKSTGKYEAKQFDDITVLFTDFVGFTSISEKLSPKELVAEIHYCFKAFDEIIGKCKLEKIKTIGDAYMAVCGMPNEDKLHAIRTVEAALEIQKFIGEYQQERKAANKSYFEIRMGIHSGSVIAGIVGVKKYAYDIWGDTVNTAARMEQNSEPGKINISGITYELIKHKFKCSYRGKIEAKNKGRIDMYFVQGQQNI